jgi:hypothetical protein
MKRVFTTLFQFLLFFLVFAVGSFLPLFHLESVLGVTPDGTRFFIWDGVVFMLLVFAIILSIEAARTRLREAGPWTALALILASIAGYAARLGFLIR